jgi:hypothetical protein
MDENDCVCPFVSQATSLRIKESLPKFQSKATTNYIKRPALTTLDSQATKLSLNFTKQLPYQQDLIQQIYGARQFVAAQTAIQHCETLQRTSMQGQSRLFL